MKKFNFLLIGTSIPVVMVCSQSAYSSIGWLEEPGYIYTDTSSSDLLAAGFENLTIDGNLTCVPAWCNGCWTSESISTGGSLMAFIGIDVTYDPANVADGFYVTMDIDFTDPNFQFEQFEAIIEESDTNIDVMQAADAGTDWSPFTDWGLDPDVTVFKWIPEEFDGSLPGPYQTTELTFGWNFSGSEGLVGGNPFSGLVVGDVGVVPAPSAIAILGIAGILNRRRRS